MVVKNTRIFQNILKEDPLLNYAEQWWPYWFPFNRKTTNGFDSNSSAVYKT
jgi:hypothetical protein